MKKVMQNNRILSSEQIESYVQLNDFGKAASLLFDQQYGSWNLLTGNYDQLKDVKVKEFLFEGYKIKAQFNPGRIISTSAKVDEKSIKERKCFLCEENLPPEQKGIFYKEEYLILCNPFPIFPNHFTLTNLLHQPQRILDTFTDLLDFSKDLSSRYSVIYNGPKCGASAPDHLHFQAGNKNFMPVDDEFHQLKNEYGTEIFENDDISVFAIDDGLRKFISIESIDKKLIEKTFKLLYNAYSDFLRASEEPLMNISAYYEEEYGWRIIIYLRAKHRSSHYFAEGEDRYLVSPAAIDLGGVIIFPREEDFMRANKELINEIFNEVFISGIILREISEIIRNRIKV